MLDAFAVLAFLRGEPATEDVGTLLRSSTVLVAGGFGLSTTTGRTVR